MNQKISFFFFFVTLILSSCALYPVNLQFYSSSVLNDNRQYHSTPVSVMIFQLQNQDKFENASTQQLWKFPHQTLGDDLVSRQSVTISPGDQRTVKIKWQDHAKYLAIVPIFRYPDADHHRAIINLENRFPFMPNRISISLVDNRMYVRCEE